MTYYSKFSRDHSFVHAISEDYFINPFTKVCEDRIRTGIKRKEREYDETKYTLDSNKIQSVGDRKCLVKQSASLPEINNHHKYPGLTLS